MSLFRRQALAPTISLFASTGTLVCCALPALFITLGMGATFAGLVSAVPQLIWLSQYKAYVFLGAGIMLGISAYTRWRSRNDPCPIDPELAHACTRMRVIGGLLLWISVALYAVGGFFAFIAPRLI
ncbi:MAG: hypothetical protein AAGI89_07105 [Pseudomonadota bacterium]